SGRDAYRRRRDAYRRGLARVRPLDHWRVRHAAGLVRRRHGRGRSGRRALLADPIDRRLRPRDGELVRRPPELRLGRGLADQERPVPARVPDRAVGPSRHRRDRLLPEDDAVRRPRRDGRDARHARRAGDGRGEGLTPLVLVLAVGGALFGVVADRLAVRWPEHDEEHPAGRPIGWRTAATAAMGAFAFALLALRFGGAPLPAQLLFGLWFASLVVGFAIDLDQRLLPDELTLPVIPLALLLDVTGQNPLVGAGVLAAVAVAVIVPIGLYLLSIPFGA